MTTPRLPDSPGFEAIAFIPAQRSASPVVHVPAQRCAPEADMAPAIPDPVSPAPAVAGRDTRLAVLWTLLGAIMGAVVLVVLVLALPLF